MLFTCTTWLKPSIGMVSLRFFRRTTHTTLYLQAQAMMYHLRNLSDVIRDIIGCWSEPFLNKKNGLQKILNNFDGLCDLLLLTSDIM